MTKRDYELIAGVLRHAIQSPNYADSVGGRRLAVDLADEFATADHRFDRERFIAACEGEDAVDSAGRPVRYSTDPLAGVRR